ncbi:LysR family transcriptional regulator [Paenibacillus alginolyticus]|uniref:LysR family transcriptional regulator n=1 Tax=Paenibacillus alginolyticus TaxID=59839 RepID=A0ABT4GGZ6_9BACL|nr:LysR family transcriptional regulator [Paenibacillus alginolyticus]MCY9695464.1 LysR family transcriptional regulator [Paenibacillus alginolyticus]MEC0146325.1 LysR family transcriptional regulator [Paenibacillus alginolyticus]
MNVFHLDMLACLMEHGSLSRAAKELGVSQPALTMRMKTLENELGVQLVSRSGNQLTVTAAGIAFNERAQRSLRVLKEGLDLISEPQGCMKVRLSVAGTPTLVTYFLPPLIGDFIRNRPNWDIPLHTGSTREVMEMLFDQVAQVGFINGHLEHPDLIILPICTYPFRLVAQPDHPLAKYARIHIFDLKHEPLLINVNESYSSYMIRYMFREHGVLMNVAMELNHSDSVKRMVMAGNGIAFLPSSVVQKEIEAAKLTALPLQLNRPLTREINLIFRKALIGHPSLEELLKHIELTSLNTPWPQFREGHLDEPSG